MKLPGKLPEKEQKNTQFDHSLCIDSDRVPERDVAWIRVVSLLTNYSDLFYGIQPYTLLQVHFCISGEGTIYIIFKYN